MKNNASRYLTLFSLLAFVALWYSCAPSGDGEVIISGQVINNTTGDPIAEAIVQITAPEEFARSTATDENGNFSFSLDVTEATEVTVRASKAGYEAKALNPFPVTAGSDVTGLSLELVPESSGGTNNEGGVQGESGGPASIILTNLQRNTIAVRETGGEEHTAFTFTVKDSAGIVVDQRAEVSFDIIQGPNGGESITPETGFINPENGSITANVASGDSSGTLRIEAVIERPEVGLTIRSSPVLITIASGFPVKENFHLGAQVFNFDAYGVVAEEHNISITASVGDLKGNPVQTGTAVYFNTEHGGKVTGNGVTNENGFANTQLFANGSRPQNHPDGIGFIEVYAQTVDVNNDYITRSTTILLTTPEAIITISPGTLSIANGGSQTFDVTVTDLNGYPMAAGTNISVEAGEGLAAAGSITDLTLANYFNPGPGTTDFQVTISDADPDNDNPTEGNFTVKVESPFGVVTTADLSGTRAKSSQ